MLTDYGEDEEILELKSHRRDSVFKSKSPKPPSPQAPPSSPSSKGCYSPPLSPVQLSSPPPSSPVQSFSPPPFSPSNSSSSPVSPQSSSPRKSPRLSSSTVFAAKESPLASPYGDGEGTLPNFTDGTCKPSDISSAPLKEPPPLSVQVKCERCGEFGHVEKDCPSILVKEKDEFSLLQKFVVELFGCFVLTFMGCGTAIGDMGKPNVTAIVFGFAIISMAYTIGPISGCHINPAVSLGVLLCSRMKILDFFIYLLAQYIGAIGAGFILIALENMTQQLRSDDQNLGENGVEFGGFEPVSALGINLGGGILLEIIMTFVFITVILVNTGKYSPTGNKAGIVIGTTLIILIATGINFTGTSVNPARSFGPALVLLVVRGQTRAMAQYWVFLVSPLIGSVLAALFCKFVFRTEEPPLSSPAQIK